MQQTKENLVNIVISDDYKNPSEVIVQFKYCPGFKFDEKPEVIDIYAYGKAYMQNYDQIMCRFEWFNPSINYNETEECGCISVYPRDGSQIMYDVNKLSNWTQKALRHDYVITFDENNIAKLVKNKFGKYLFIEDLFEDKI